MYLSRIKDDMLLKYHLLKSCQNKKFGMLNAVSTAFSDRLLINLSTSSSLTTLPQGYRKYLGRNQIQFLVRSISMGAFAVQGLAYYLFKMFFQQNMDDKARMAAMERERRMRYRNMEVNFDRRRQDMELRMQERQLESELNWMEANPGKTPPWIEQRLSNTTSYSDFIPSSPIDDGEPFDLGLNFDEDGEKPKGRVRGSDGKFKKKE